MLIFTGVVTSSVKAWIGAVAVVGLCVLAQIFLTAPRIEEGHNVFVVDGPGGALEAGLPPEAFRFMQAEFDAKYPPERRCDPAISAAGAARVFRTGRSRSPPTASTIVRRIRGG